MNFLVGSLLYHSEEYIAFWLIIELIENYNLRENYQEGKKSLLTLKTYFISFKGFPGLKIHNKKINKVFKYSLKEKYNEIQSTGVDISFVVVEWVFSLFCSLIPIDLQIEFFINFFETKWDFFYKVCYCLFQSKDFSGITDGDEVYMLLKFSKSNDKTSKEKEKFWENVLNKANELEINL